MSFVLNRVKFVSDMKENIKKDGENHVCPCDDPFVLCRNPVLYINAHGERKQISCGAKRALRAYGKPNEGTELHQKIVDALKILSVVRK